MNHIPPAPHYTSCTDLWCVTAYFNPAHYSTRRANFETFAAPIRAAGIPLLTVEYAVGDDAFDLPPGPDILQVRGPHVLWQKERLINLGVAHLPPEATKIAWLDGDILFTKADWAVETARLLDEFPSVQPFAHAILLSRNSLAAHGTDYALDSFASKVAHAPATLQTGSFQAHGHTGFAWAGRREWLARYGLYDAFLNGGGDHYIAHALAGDLDSPCMMTLRGASRLKSLSLSLYDKNFIALLRQAMPIAWKMRFHSPLKWLLADAPWNNLPIIYKDFHAFWRHFETWARPLAAATGRIGWAPGEVLHLWHGDADRGYRKGWLTLCSNGFDPAVDLRIGSSGCFEWASDKPALQTWARQFFTMRREDGD